MISRSSINFKGWVGSGYTVLDKNTGTGAYMISGGMNGANIIIGIIGAVLILVSIYLLTSFAAAAILFLGAMILIIGLVFFLSFIARAILVDDVKPSCKEGINAITSFLAYLAIAKSIAAKVGVELELTKNADLLASLIGWPSLVATVQNFDPGEKLCSW